ncbi:zinc-binding alcohol dehydrogenase family protein [Microbacterium sp. ARD32]|uniref:quinone oxidoreductase family protein n=1 Tax=Microbacterium sp. ARD32 TaxID=2962577 RepID=UPI00288124B1|nr:zinc-binding alcohol dehydrogenase family protein [Microbacterium sp. ARD32]MDT0157150.1 zinc-binding alcohol dehydrogenase family protein [Microbacterium sp. ARD32]
MHAATLTHADRPPVYATLPEPTPGPGQIAVDVLAAGLHHLTRGRATGQHYSNGVTLPLTPGVDGVVRDETGTLRYVVLDDTVAGTFAERTVIDPDRSVVLPAGTDPVIIAAAMNPAMSSWVALRRRIEFPAGARVLVTGATGASGRLAVQIAKLLGAGHVIAAGRNRERLEDLRDLGADQLIGLDEFEAAADADVVLDYLWGAPAASALIPMLTRRRDRSAPLTWVQIGSMAGDTAPIPGAALRSSRLQIVGSGIGSVPARDLIAELPAIAEALSSGALRTQAHAVPLREIEHYWDAPSVERIVFVP